MSLAVAWGAIGLATLAAGSYWPGGIVALVVALGAILLPRAWRRGSPERAEQALWGAALLGVVLNLSRVVYGVGTQRHDAGWGEPWIGLGQAVMLFAVLLLARPLHEVLPRHVRRAVFPAALGAATVAGACLIAGVPDPRIDVFYFLNEGLRGLLQGQNPYTMYFTPLPAGISEGYRDPAYQFDVYSYLPGTLLLNLPTAVVGDTRWAGLSVVLVSAMLVRALLIRWGTAERFAELAGLAFVCYPGLPLVLQQAWVEPLIVGFWLAALWTSVRQPRLGVLCTGLFLAVKQYAPPLVAPLVAGGMSWRQVLLSLLVPISLSLPFAIWSPGDFWWDGLWYQVQAPARSDALSFNGLLLNTTGGSLPGWLTMLAPLAGAAGLGWLLLRGSDQASVLRATAAFYLLLFLFNKFAYANYYFMLHAIVLVALGAEVGRAVTERCARAQASADADPVATRVPVGAST